MTDRIPPWSGRPAARATAWVLERDAGLCWICGHPGADSLDHVKPRSTHPELTWEPSNWKAAHGAGRPDLDCPGQYSRGNYPGPRRPTTSTHQLHVVIGPPCAGKTTWIEQHRQPTDIVVDHDALAQALGAPTSHTHTGPHATAARHARTAVVTHLLDNPTQHTAWIIHTAPTPQHLHAYTRAGATPHLIDPGRPTALHRARTQRESWTIPAVNDWYQHHADRLHTWTATTHAPAAATTQRDW